MRRVLILLSYGLIGCGLTLMVWAELRLEPQRPGGLTGGEPRTDVEFLQGGGRRTPALPCRITAPVEVLVDVAEEWLVLARRYPESVDARRGVDRLVEWVLQREMALRRSGGLVVSAALSLRDHRALACRLCRHFEDRNAPDTGVLRALAAIARSGGGDGEQL